MDSMRVITADEVQKKLTMTKAIEAMKGAFSDLSSGKAQVPERVPLHTPTGSEYLFMPAYYPSGGITTVKSVGINNDNPGKGLPLIHAAILAFDQETGKPIALVDGGSVTAIRTAAASGLATQLLSNPDARIGAIFGTGVQASAHLEAINCVRELEKVLIYGREIAKSQDFCLKHQSTIDVELVPSDNLIELKTADVICTTTTSSTPLFDASHIKSGAHVNAVGVYKPQDQELPEDLVREALVFIDQWEGAMSEAGDLLVPMSKGLIKKEHFRRELGQLILGELDYSWSSDKTTLFKSVGNAIQDAAAVSAIL